VGSVEVDTTVTFDGFMDKSAVYGHEDDVKVIERDWNDHVSILSAGAR
jgi:hypothetical protein